MLLAASGALLLVAAGILQPLAAWAIDTVAPLLALLVAFSVAMLLRVEGQARALVGHIGSLAASDNLMRQLVDSSFDAIITFANNGRVLSCNRAAERIFGTPAGTLIGTPIARLLPDRHGRWLEALAQAGGSHELSGQDQDGRRFPIEATFSRIQVDEKWVGLAIVRDITELKAQQAELERMALHDALTAAQPDAVPRPDRARDRRRQTRPPVDGGAAPGSQPLQGRHSAATNSRSCCRVRPISRPPAGSPSGSSTVCGIRSRSRSGSASVWRSTPSTA